MTEQDKIEFLNYAIAKAQDLKELPAASSSDAIESVVAKTSVGDMKLLPYSNLKVAADSALSPTSTNPIQNKVVKAALDGKQDKLTAGSGIIINGSIISATSSGGISMTVDAALSSTSTNPVQNKVVKEALDKKQDAGDYATNTALTEGLAANANSADVYSKTEIDDTYAKKTDIPSAYTLPTASSDTLGGVKIGTGLSIDDNGVLSSTGGTGGITVDSELSSTSTNPVQNNVITESLNGKADKEHTHTLSEITDYEEPDLSPYAKKADVDSALADKADKATTLEGYGITDAATKTYVDSELAAKQDALTAGSGIIINGSEISTAYKIWHGSQAEYDAIAAKDDMTIYLIEES